MTDSIKTNLQRVTLTLAAVSLGMVVLLLGLDLYFTHQFSMSVSVRRIFVVTYEDSIGTWYSVLIAAVVAAVLWLHVFVAKRNGSSKLTRATWITLAIMLTYASIDDGAKVHERIGSMTAETLLLNQRDNAVNQALSDVVSSFPSYSWQVVYFPILVLAGIVLLRVLFIEFTDLACRLLVMVGLGCFVIAIGIDFMEGVPDRGNPDWFPFMSDQSPLTRHYFKAVEECLEMAGMALLFTGFSRNLLILQPRWTLEVE